MHMQELQFSCCLLWTLELKTQSNLHMLVTVYSPSSLPLITDPSLVTLLWAITIHDDYVECV